MVVLLCGGVDDVAVGDVGVVDVGGIVVVAVAGGGVDKIAPPITSGAMIDGGCSCFPGPPAAAALPSTAATFAAPLFLTSPEPFTSPCS